MADETRAAEAIEQELADARRMARRYPAAKTRARVEALRSEALREAPKAAKRGDQ